MTIGELKEILNELEVSDDTELICYDPAAHEVIPIDSAEKGMFDPHSFSFLWKPKDEEDYGIPCLALFI
jgi:hypothetical protein